MKKDYLFHHRGSPILFSIPHDGSEIPDDIAVNMHEYALNTPDRDSYVAQLYSFAKDFDISLLKTHISRYVIDLNRSSENVSLYSRQNETQLCPTSTFDERPIYKSTELEPDAAEVQRRTRLYWQPYHQIIADKLEVIKQQHGYAILVDCHSIKSEVPRFFEGTLPDINIGTFDRASCSEHLHQQMQEVLQNQKHYSYVFNERFKGGHITRNYGDPGNDIHAIQIELAQSTYMDEASNRYDMQKAEQLKSVLIRLIHALKP